MGNTSKLFLSIAAVDIAIGVAVTLMYLLSDGDLPIAGNGVGNLLIGVFFLVAGVGMLFLSRWQRNQAARAAVDPVVRASSPARSTDPR